MRYTPDGGRYLVEVVVGDARPLGVAGAVFVRSWS